MKANSIDNVVSLSAVRERKQTEQKETAVMWENIDDKRQQELFSLLSHELYLASKKWDKQGNFQDWWNSESIPSFFILKEIMCRLAEFDETGNSWYDLADLWSDFVYAIDQPTCPTLREKYDFNINFSAKKISEGDKDKSHMQVLNLRSLTAEKIVSALRINPEYGCAIERKSFLEYLSRTATESIIKNTPDPLEALLWHVAHIVGTDRNTGSRLRNLKLYQQKEVIKFWTAFKRKNYRQPDF
jgi:hypothetical protein